MNTDLLKSFAQRLTHQPHLLAQTEDQMLRSLLLRHSTGLLDEAASKEADALIASDLRAAAIWTEFQASDEHLKTEAGKTWLRAARDILLERTLPSNLKRSCEAPSPAIHEEFFTRLSTWIVGTFSGLRLQGAYSDTSAGQRKVFPAAADDPYKPWLVQDRMGRWYLRVVTEDAEAAKVRLRLELEREMPVLEFQPKGDGEFFAEVRLTEAMAEALKSGHRPVFHPVE